MMDVNTTNEEKLEDGQMVATAIGFLLGGYETTSNALSFTTYLLALNPEVQDRLANEIHDYKQANEVSMNTVWIQSHDRLSLKCIKAFAACNNVYNTCTQYA